MAWNGTIWVTTFDWYWKSMTSWVGMKNVLFCITSFAINKSGFGRLRNVAAFNIGINIIKIIPFSCSSLLMCRGMGYLRKPHDRSKHLIYSWHMLTHIWPVMGFAQISNAATYKERGTSGRSNFNQIVLVSYDITVLLKKRGQLYKWSSRLWNST